MNKLLHERLREHDNGTGRISIVSSKYEITLRDHEAKALADEIERYYIPRPRFEDGSPVTDEVFPCGSFFKIYLDGSWILEEIGEKKQEGSYFDLAKRPQAKVIDADGVEINVGDTVWVIGGADDGKKLTVKGFEPCASGVVYVSCGERSLVNILRSPYDLTHKEPDSLEKLRDDMFNEFSNLGRYELKGYANRLSALIERGA